MGSGFSIGGAVLPGQTTLAPASSLAPAALSLLPSVSLPQTVVPRPIAAVPASAAVATPLGLLQAGAQRAESFAKAGVGQAYRRSGLLYHNGRDNGSVAADFFPDSAAPVLPGYLSVADPGDAAWLALVHEAAQNSKTARKVLREIKELTGNGREPVILETEESQTTDGDYTFDWEVVRIARDFRKKDPIEAVPAFIHELTHAVQKAQDLPFNAIELEVEAHLNQMKVAHELGVTFNKEQFHHGLSRTFKASVKGMAESLLGTDQYARSVSLDGATFAELEATLRRWEKSEQNSIDRWEDYLKGRKTTFDELKNSGMPERFLKAYRADEILGIQQGVTNGETALHLIRRDLRILRTSVGRQRYLDFARRVYRDAQAFHRRYAGNAPQKNVGRIQLPSQRSVSDFILREEPRVRRAKTPTAAPVSDAILPRALKTIAKEDQGWLAEVALELGKSLAGKKLLEELDAAAHNRRRPFVIEFSPPAWKVRTGFRPDYDLVQINGSDKRISPRDYAPLLAYTLTRALRTETLPRYALEIDLEGLVKGVAVARDLGVTLRKGSLLYEASRDLKMGTEHLVRSLGKLHRDKYFLAERGSEGVEKMLARKHRQLIYQLKKKREYLRDRNATYRLMRKTHHTHVFQRSYHADEIVRTQSALANIETTLDAVKRDLWILHENEKLLAYQTYAEEVLSSAASLGRD